MEYEVIIDLGSKTFNVNANSEEEAKTIALTLFEQLPDKDKINEYWVGDVSEVEE